MTYDQHFSRMKTTVVGLRQMIVSLLDVMIFSGRVQWFKDELIGTKEEWTTKLSTDKVLIEEKCPLKSFCQQFV